MKANSPVFSESNLDVQQYLCEQQKIINHHLDLLLVPAQVSPEIVHEAMRYSVFVGGKRIRPILALATGEVLGVDPGALMHLACALEMVHTYSLVHDDLPSMDDHDYRRGRLTTHKKFGEGIAILAGNALLTLAFQILAEIPPALTNNRIAIIRQLCKSLGTEKGFIGGQVMDLQAQDRTFSEDQLKKIHSFKTGALIQASVLMPALLFGASKKTCNALKIFGANVGLAFQIVDDILDIESSSEELGKTSGKDELNQKATYPALYGLEISRKLASQLIDSAIKEVSFLGSRTYLLKKLAQFISVRRF